MKRAVVLILAIFLCIALFTAITPQEFAYAIDLVHTGNTINMVVFLSPQYSGDSQIVEAIENYTAAVYDDIGWNISLNKLQTSNNTVGNIRRVIREYYSDNIYAAMMVGEDISTACSGETAEMETPSIIPWAEMDEPITAVGEEIVVIEPEVVGVEFDSLIAGKKIASGSHIPDVCISLIYPTAEWSYEIKKDCIISVFEKFSNRVENTEDLSENDVVFFLDNSTDFNYTPRIWERFWMLGNPRGVMAATSSREQIDSIYGENLKVLGSLGHGAPNLAHALWLNDLSLVNASLLLLGGCYTNGWYTDGNETINNILDPSLGGWFGEQIFLHPSLKAIIAGNPYEGFLSYGGYDLAVGKTIAEALINKGPVFFDDLGTRAVNAENQIVFGDPTFHFEPTNIPIRTLHVPTQYATLQEALDFANPGDTVVLEEGTHYESVYSNTDNIVLRGETQSSMLDGAFSESAIRLSGNNVTLYNLTVQNSIQSAITVMGNNMTLQNITVQNSSDYGICLWGIFPDCASNIRISENVITNNGWGIYCHGATSSQIFGNTIKENNKGGIFVSGSNFIDIYQNKITHNSYPGYAGIGLGMSSYCLIHENDISNNWLGMSFSSSHSNMIYANNFTGNTLQVYVGFPANESANTWENVYSGKGNYWSDYSGVDANGDSIGDTAHVIDAYNQDNYPLMSPFGIPGYLLSVEVSGSGSTSPTIGYYTYVEDTEVVVTATPASGWAFSHWLLDSVNVGSNNPQTVTMNANHSLTAIFSEIPLVLHNLTIAVSGSGSTSPVIGTYSYEEGSQVEVTAFPSTGWSLSYWLLDSVNVGSANPYTLTINANHSLIAVYAEIPVEYTITIQVNGSGTTSPNVGVHTYSVGNIGVVVTAFSDSGWIFSNWLLDSVNVGNANPYIDTLNTDHTLTAVFTEIQFGTETFHVIVEPNTYVIDTCSNSSVSDFDFNQTLKQLSFNVTGATGTVGVCNVSIPTELLGGTFSIYLNGEPLFEDLNYTRTYNGTHNIFQFTYTHSTHKLEITGTEVIPEFSSWLIPILMLTATSVIVIFKKKLRKQSPQ